MEQYSICKMLGEGSYGIVWKALDLETGEEVAIKALKNNYPSWEKCKAEWGRSHPLSEDTIRDMTSHLLQGLCCIHGKGYFHRDLKPENLLLQSGVLKIADFGMARDVNSSLPLEKEVTTLWYRAPEVLLGKTYDEKIDMWAVGVIMAELYNSEPLFPGANNVDQLHRIWEVVGVSDDLRDPLEFDRKQNLHSTLRRLIPRASDSFDSYFLGTLRCALLHLGHSFIPSSTPRMSTSIQLQSGIKVNLHQLDQR